MVLYPIVDKEVLQEGESYLVSISNLKPGQYQIRFIIDEKGEEFEALPVREVNLRPGETVEINEIIYLRYGSLTAYNDVSALDILPDNPYKISLIDEEREVIFQSDSGELNVEKVLPGQYTLLFEEDETLIFPLPVLLNIQAGEKVGPLVGEYVLNTGQISVQYSTGPELY